MDRSKDFSTVHGERAPGDPDAKTHFLQNGLPFDINGHLLFDHADFELAKGDDCSKQAKKLRDLAELKLKKASKGKPVVPSSDTDAPSEAGEEVGAQTDIDDDDEAEPEEVNLEAWMRGEAEYQWNLVTQQIARRYKRRVSNKGDAIEFLFKEKLVPKSEISRAFQKFLD
jgi:hypothetical protein